MTIKPSDHSTSFDRTFDRKQLYSRRARLLNLIGIVMLALGLGGAGLVYWPGTRNPDFRDDLSMVNFDRAQARQMGQLYGQSGLLMEDLGNDLKQPGNQAIIILVVTGLTASACFYFARLLTWDVKSAEQNDSL